MVDCKATVDGIPVFPVETVTFMYNGEYFEYPCDPVVQDSFDGRKSRVNNG